ncbi:hypothetical protein OBBRIDRAFT_694754, partial [Obba rivulosa]
MTDDYFTQLHPAFEAYLSDPTAAHSAEPAAHGLDQYDYSKQSFDFSHYTQAAADILAPHPDQFESELDSLVPFDSDINLLSVPIDTTGDLFSLLRSDTPTYGTLSSFTASTESVSAYDSSYNDTLSVHSESVYSYVPSPTNNYSQSDYGYSQQLDMEFQRMAMPPHDDNSFGTIPPSPSIRSSPSSVPNISHYSPTTSFSSPRGSFSDYEPAQPQQVRIGSSAASDYYPQTRVQLNERPQYPGASARSVPAQDNTSQVPSIPSMSQTTSHRSIRADSMQDDGKRKYQCPSCPRAFVRAFNLKTHMQTHDPNRAKPYTCTFKSCGRSFSRKHDLTRHNVSIHRAEASSGSPVGVGKGDREWCDSCGKSYGKGKDKGCDCE